MHETVIAKKIIEEAKKHGSVKSIVVEVGDLGHLPADDMENVLKEMVDWEVTVKRKKAKVQCGCGYVGEPVITHKSHDFNMFQCATCNSLSPVVLEGDQIILKEVKVK